MEGKVAKRRRVYSPEPNKAAQEVFTRNYVSYLVPALTKIMEKSTPEEHGGDNRAGDTGLQEVVKYEVDMAMAFSAQGFAWSNALKAKLLQVRDRNVFSNPNPNPESQAKILERDENEDVDDDNDDGDVMDGQLRSLRRLVPGGEEMMCNEEMVGEVESYVRCLQMQVNTLQYLTDQIPT